MKKYSYFLSALSIALLYTSVLLFSSCGGDDDPTAQEKAMKLLVGTWTVNSVTVDGVNHSDLFTGFTITFTDNPPAYSTANGGLVWDEPGGNINFTNANATAFNRGDGKEVTISSLTSNSLVLKLNWDKTTFGGGRTESVSGEHTFTLSK
jgi:hypothetical protein